MTIAAELKINPVGRSPLARSVRWLGSTALGARVFAQVSPRLDATVMHLSGGRATASEWIAGLPTVHLTTTGARSGQQRTVALAAVVVGDDVALIGSNWGRARHPGWVHNLAANPDAVVSRAGRSVPVRAVEARDGEAERVWAQARSLYRSFRTYPERTGGRQIRVFLLRPRDRG